MYAARSLGRRCATVTRLAAPKKNAVHAYKRSFSSSASSIEKVKSFWWVTIPAGLLAFTGMLYEIKNYFDVRDFPDIDTYLPDESGAFWNETYSRLMEVYLWEPYLDAGIVQKGLKQLRDTLPFLLEFDYAFTVAARKKVTSSKGSTAESVELINLISMSDKATYISSRTVKTLLRLCEMEPVAKEIIESGGFELICKYMQTGRTPVYYYRLLLALTSEESLCNQIISRPEFISTMEKLIVSKVGQSDSVAFGVLRQMIKKVEIGRRIYYDDEFQLLREVIEKNKNKSETTRAFSAALTNKRRYLPDLLASFPMKKCFDMSLEGLPATIYQFAFTGIVGAAYCGLRWKAKLPSLSWSFFSRKMAYGFAGAASPFVIRFTSHLMYGENTKVAIENRIFGQSTNKLVAPSVLLMADTVRWSLFLTLFFTSWFYGKYLLLPSVVGGLWHVLKIPSSSDVSRGRILKTKF